MHNSNNKSPYHTFEFFISISEWEKEGTGRQG